MNKNRIIGFIVAVAFISLIITFVFIKPFKKEKADTVSKGVTDHQQTLVNENSPKEAPVSEYRNKKLSQDNGKQLYTCPMHPQVISDHPGNCPICGFTLVKKKTNQVNVSQQKASTEMDEISLSSSQQVLANVAVDTVKRKILTKEINTVGRITYNESSSTHVSSWIAGRINKLYINFTGAEIGKGQKMMEIYSPDLVATQQEYIQAYESYLRLKNSSFKDITDSSLSLLEASRQKLLLLGIKDFQLQELKSTRKPQINLTIYSPASGVVVKKNVQEGQYVNTGDNLFDITDLSNVWMEADVYEYEMGNLKKGEDIEITTDTYQDETFKGKITFINPSLDPMSKTVKVRAEFLNRNYKLKPEMTVNAKIKTVLASSLVVPRNAVIITGKKRVVWVQKKEGVFVPRTVKIGQPTDEYYPILSGLKEGEKIAVSGSFLIDSESQISSMSNMPGMDMGDNKGLKPLAQPTIKPGIDFSKDLKASPKDDMDMSKMKM